MSTPDRFRRAGSAQLASNIKHLLFSRGEHGAYYNPDDLSSLCQTIGGTVGDVTAIGDPVGRMEDLRAAEVFTTAVHTSDFSAGVGSHTFVRAAGAAVDGIFGEDDVLRTTVDTSSNTHYTVLNSILTIGKKYRISLRYYIPSGQTRVNGIRVDYGAAPIYQLSTLDAWTTYTVDFVAQSTNQIFWATYGGALSFQDAGGDDVYYIKDIVITASNLNHATQATAGSRPLLGIQPKSGVRNLITYSESFDNAAWTKSSGSVASNTATAPNGTITADTFTPTASAAFHYCSQSFTLVAASTYTYSCYFKKTSGGARYAYVLVGGTNEEAVFDLDTGLVSNTSAGVTGAITSVGSDWFRCSMTFTKDSTEANFFVGPTTSATTGNSTTATSDTIYIWGAQLESGSAATTYQYKGAWYDCRESNAITISDPNHAKFLAPDGVDDYMTIPGSASSMKYLHDGTGGLIVLGTAIEATNGDTFNSVFGANNGTAAKYGMWLGVRNSNNAFIYDVAEGHATLTNRIEPASLSYQTPAIVSTQFSTATIRIAKNGVLLESAATSITPAGNNASQDYVLLATGTGTGGVQDQMYGKLFNGVILDGIPSAKHLLQAETILGAAIGISI